MLEHMGAQGIDADALGHRAIAKGAPGYQQVVDLFGRWIIGPNGEINRARLGKVVFSDKEALALLEGIVHPLVTQALDWMVQRSTRPVIVVEAIKLLEANLHRHCDSVWVVYAPPEVQMTRLVQKRGMSEAEARQRIAAQSPQEQKMAAASVVIKNNTNFEDAWRQVMGAWGKFVPVMAEGATAAPAKPAVAGPQTNLTVLRGRPRDSESIAALINRVKKPMPAVTRNDIMAEFGEKAYLLVKAGDQMVGVAGWQVENLVARTTEIVIDPAAPAGQVLPVLVTEMERSSKDLQCEAALIFIPTDLSVDSIWQSLGYERRTPQSLGVAVWQEPAAETIKPGQILFFKQLRQDRVLRPI
jgi:dephospho-CoA kinase